MSLISLFPSRTVALEVFDFSVRWYGLLYLAGFLLAYFLLPKLQHYRGLSLTKKEWADILTSAVLGVIVGGRLGYVLFYAPQYFLERPLEIFAVWHGGMSSHGGFLGVTLALFLALRRRKIPVLPFADVVVIPIACGLALGRVGNFINQELYGTITDLPWGIVVPGVEGLRHPTQIYAVIKDLFIAGICYVHLVYTPHPGTGAAGALWLQKPHPSVGAIMPGRTCILFLLLYGVLRFLLEFLRVQEHTGFTIGDLSLTRGQLLTIPIIVAGMVMRYWTGRSPLPAGEGQSEGRS